MARLLVQYPGDAGVLIDGERRGEVNRVIALDPGEHTIAIDGEATNPREQRVTVASDDDPERVIGMSFHPERARLDRFSPLYCRYNGFLLGQFLSLSFANFGRDKYAERRMRMLEFLDEIDVGVDIPDEPFAIGDSEHAALLETALPLVAARSPDLAEFTALGGAFAHYGVLARTDPETASQLLESIEHIRAKHQLPELSPEDIVIDADYSDVDRVLSPSLAWLTRAIDRLDIEQDTAFVIMPFAQPYASYFSTFYRPALEGAGYRAFRAWGGLSNEDYCDLLLRLIAKCGLVWADVSELNVNVLYEIGAAHALGKLSMLVVRKDVAHAVPANIGHDAVVQYSTTESWPDEAIQLGSVFVTALPLAAERGERLRVGPGGMQDVLDWVGARLEEIVIPPEAREAAARGNAEFEAHDYAAAERSYDDAIHLGLDEPRILFGRGASRVSLERYADAESDLTLVIDSDADPSLRSAAHFFRGIAREEQDRRTEAHADYTAALDLGFDDDVVNESIDRTR